MIYDLTASCTVPRPRQAKRHVIMADVLIADNKFTVEPLPLTCQLLPSI